MILPAAARRSTCSRRTNRAVAGRGAGRGAPNVPARREWVGCLAESDLAKAGVDKAEYLMGPAGSITIHNCRTVHGSRPNLSDIGRPLLLNTLSSSDAFPYTYNPLTTRYYGQVIRGEPARWAHHDPRPCLLPPDWSGGYTSIFALQQEESWEADSDESNRGRQRALAM